MTFFREAMKRARFGILEDDGTFCGEIPGLRGVLANARTLKECRAQLEEVEEMVPLVEMERRLRLPPWLRPEEVSRLTRFAAGVRAIVPKHHLAKLCLYGSRARGEGHVFSDLDVLVVLRGPIDEYRHRIIDLELAIEEADGHPEQGYLSVVKLSEADWRFNIRRELLFSREVREQGIPL
jgi:predicted nucleotidyltransferase